MLIAPLPEAPEQWAAAGVSGPVPGVNAPLDGAVFGPVAETLVAEAILNNPTLEARRAAVRAAAAQARAARGRTLPQLNVSGQAGLASQQFQTPAGDERTTDTTFGLGVDLGWEADIWGRLEASVDAAALDLAASLLEAEAAERSIAASAVISYVNLSAAVQQLRVAELSVEARRRIVTFTERRVERGTASALDVRLSRSALFAAEAQLAQSAQQVAEAARNLEILLGRYPGALIDASAELPRVAPIELAASPPLLLSRRPDIAAQERRVEASGLRAEAARLALLPALRLTGSLSTNATDLADALDPAAIAARAIASIAQPLYDGGTLRAQYRAQLAQAESQLAQYAAAALDAWREVEDALAAETFLAQQEAAQLRAFEESVEAEELAFRQYRLGLIPAFNLLDAQTRRLNSESALVAVRARRSVNRVSYHLAIGDGLSTYLGPEALAGVRAGLAGPDALGLAASSLEDIQ